jgi:hypothetical protein
MIHTNTLPVYIPNYNCRPDSWKCVPLEEYKRFENEVLQLNKEVIKLNDSLEEITEKIALHNSSKEKELELINIRNIIKLKIEVANWTYYIKHNEYLIKHYQK